MIRIFDTSFAPKTKLKTSTEFSPSFFANSTAFRPLFLLKNGLSLFHRPSTSSTCLLRPWSSINDRAPKEEISTLPLGQTGRHRLQYLGLGGRPRSTPPVAKPTDEGDRCGGCGRHHQRYNLLTNTAPPFHLGNAEKVRGD